MKKDLGSKKEYLNEAKIYLDHLNPERAADYDDWLKVGMGLEQVEKLY